MTRALAIIVSCLLPALAPAQPDAPPPDRLARLARGVGLSHWIWYPSGSTRQERALYFTVEDGRRLAAAGFTHVRLPFSPGLVWDDSTHGFRADALAELHACVRAVLGSGLAVVVDAHPYDAPWVRPDASGRAPEFERFWGALAREFSSSDPDLVFLEILNEPAEIARDAGGDSVWPGAQRSLAAIIRAQAPRHTIILTGEEWGGIEGLLGLKPIDDPNVVYSFHFYEPHVFTHQGATWGWEPWKFIKGLPFPAEAEGVNTVAANIWDERAQGAVRRYALDRWDAAKIRDRIATAIEWGARHRVPVYCGEFGVIRRFAPRESRLAWIEAVRAALDAGHVGWALWDFAGEFALTDGEPGARTLDRGVLDALGLGAARGGPAPPDR